VLRSSPRSLILLSLSLKIVPAKQQPVARTASAQAQIRLVRLGPLSTYTTCENYNHFDRRNSVEQDLPGHQNGHGEDRNNRVNQTAARFNFLIEKAGENSTTKENEIGGRGKLGTVNWTHDPSKGNTTDRRTAPQIQTQTISNATGGGRGLDVWGTSELGGIWPPAARGCRGELLRLEGPLGLSLPGELLCCGWLRLRRVWSVWWVASSPREEQEGEELVRCGGGWRIGKGKGKRRSLN
jgi:hypothetical protein